MSIFVSDELMYSVFKRLFDRVETYDPKAAEQLIKSRLAVGIKTRAPTAEVTFDAQHAPLQVIFGKGEAIPGVQIGLTADTLHCILLGELGIRKALGRGLLDIKGPIWKMAGLVDLFRHAQRFYPEVLFEYGLPGTCPASVF